LLLLLLLLLLGEVLVRLISTVDQHRHYWNEQYERQEEVEDILILDIDCIRENTSKKQVCTHLHIIPATTATTATAATTTATTAKPPATTATTRRRADGADRHQRNRCILLSILLHSSAPH
jgi:hypothetical protein